MKLFKKTEWAIAAVFMLLVGCSAQTAGAAAGSAGDFTLKDAAGKSVSLKGELASHKAVLVNFWATWCPPCREEIPGLIKLQAKYAAKGFTVLGVVIGESAAKVTSFAGKAGINYPLVLDSDQGVAESYHVVGIPTSFLIASDGKILGEYHAYTPDLVSAVEEAVS